MPAPAPRLTVQIQPAILLSSAANVTIANNTITGAGTDLGICGLQQHERHDLQQRRRPHRARLAGPHWNRDRGLSVGHEVALICNTFSGWQPNRNIVGAVQMSCTPLPNG